MSHTPGEWKLADSEPFVYALNGAGTNRFCALVQPGWLAEGVNLPSDPRTSDDELMANARLIAAAPELLVALREIVRGDVGATLSGSQCVEIAQAAIAKAEGK